MKIIRFHSPRNLFIGLCLSLSLLAGCATNTNKSSDSQDPDAVLTQAKLAYKEQQYHEAFQLLLPLAVAGNDQAQYALGYFYYYGLGLEKNEQQAITWIQRAAAQGNKKALQALQ